MKTPLHTLFNPQRPYLRMMAQLDEEVVMRGAALYLERLAPGKGVKMWEKYQKDKRKQK